jgi:peptidoglycan/LPS O-acetylase OafA/YrhL
MVRWPSTFGIIWEFSLLCCFPAGLFVWAAVSSGAVHRPPMAKIVIIVVVLHCLLLAGTVYLWSRNPKSITGDFGFGFVVIELIAIWSLMRLARPRREAPDSGK